ncbi:MAG: GntR family transcriptional regulator [Deinococcota bacterium]
MMQIDPKNPMPLYYQLYSMLKASITRGELSSGDALPAERKLADIHNVSRITVVKAIDLLEKDALVERQQGRGTFVLAKQAKRTRTPTLGFLAGGLIHPYHYGIQMGIAKVASQARVNLNVLAHYHTAYQTSTYELDELSSRIDGLIVYPRGERDASFYQQLSQRGLPLVMVDRYLTGIDADTVTFDDEFTAYHLTEILLQRGHRRVAFVNYSEPDVSSSRNRLQGFAKALQDRDLVVSEDNVWLDLYADYLPLEQSHSQTHLTQRLLDKLEETKVTGLVAINHDVAARLAYDLMLISSERAHLAATGGGDSDYNLRVEVTAFGHKHPADYSPFHIAVAMQPGEALGKHAAEMLLTRLNEPDQPPHHERLPIEILHHVGSEVNSRFFSPFNLDAYTSNASLSASKSGVSNASTSISSASSPSDAIIHDSLERSKS